MQALTWPFAGDYDLVSDTFGGGFPQWLVSDVWRRLNEVRERGAATPDDVVWAERVVGEVRSALLADFRPCFVMNDYNPNNVVVGRVRGGWHVTGLFDLMEYYFGDGEADLVGLTAIHLDAEQPHGAQLAHAFGAAYLESRQPRPGFAERYKLFIMRDRLIVWEYRTRPEIGWFPERWSFREYAERYLAGRYLLEPGSA